MDKPRDLRLNNSNVISNRQQMYRYLNTINLNKQKQLKQNKKMKKGLLILIHYYYMATTLTGYVTGIILIGKRNRM